MSDRPIGRDETDIKFASDETRLAPREGSRAVDAELPGQLAGGNQPTFDQAVLNHAFLREIKQDNIALSDLLKSTHRALTVEAEIRPRTLFELLDRLRDELETHFALEEFYGYVDRSSLTNPSVAKQVHRLKAQHRELYLEIAGLLEETERLIYHELPYGRPLTDIVNGFFEFYRHLQNHEQEEMELAMDLANQDLGTGD